MTDEQKKAMVTTMCGESDSDILSTYLTIAANKILHRAYPFGNVTEVPSRYEVLQCEIASYLINKRGAEGQTSHSENGINRTYENGDVPESMLREIIPFVGTFQSEVTDE